MSLAMLSNGDSSTQNNLETKEKRREKILNCILSELHEEAAFIQDTNPYEWAPAPNHLTNNSVTNVM